jgi:hypothetical protein
MEGETWGTRSSDSPVNLESKPLQGKNSAPTLSSPGERTGLAKANAGVRRSEATRDRARQVFMFLVPPGSVEATERSLARYFRQGKMSRFSLI